MQRSTNKNYDDNYDERRTYGDDKEVDDLLRIPLKIKDERIRDVGRGCKDDDDLRVRYIKTRLVSH